MAFWRALGYFLLMFGFASLFAVLIVYNNFFRPNVSVIGDVVLGLFFGAGAALLLPRVLTTRVDATLLVDSEGVRFVRAFKRRVNLRWSEVELVRHGFRRIRSMKVSSVGYALHVAGRAKSRDQLIEVDDVNYSVSRNAMT